MPPWNQSVPVPAPGGVGFGGVLPCRFVSSEKDPPPSVDLYTPRVGAFGGVRRPPLTDAEPCRATSVPMKIVLGKPLRIAIAPMDRLVATDADPGTSVQLWPPLVLLNRPRPASESPEPLGSPEPAYSVLPLGSLGSMTSEPNALVGRDSGGAIQLGVTANASLVRQ